LMMTCWKHKGYTARLTTWCTWRRSKVESDHIRLLHLVCMCGRIFPPDGKETL
jgi:hypothetical protein